MNSLFVKKGDTVKMLAGKNKGKTGKILSVDPEANRVVVDGLNIIVKHVKPRGAQNPGGLQKVPGGVDASNVQIVCPTCGKTTRVAHSEADGKKIRVCKKCGASLDVKVKAEKKTAKKSVKKDESASETAEKKTVKKTTAKKTTAKKDDAASEPAAEKKTAKKTTAKKAEETSENA